MSIKPRNNELEQKVKDLKKEVARYKRDYEALNTYKELNRALFDRLHDCVFISDLEGSFIDVNAAALSLFGYKKRDIKSLSFISILDQDQLIRAFTYLNEMKKTGSLSESLELTATHKNGSPIEVEVKGSLIFQDGKPNAVLGVARDITHRKKAEAGLKRTKEELERKVKQRTADLEETNAALQILLKQREKDRNNLEENILDNLKELVMPYLEKLKASELNNRERTLLEILESNLNHVASPIVRNLSSNYLNFTPTEIQVANLIKQGKTTKEIASLLNISKKTIETHRYKIRKKMGIINKKKNLRTRLLSLQ